MDRETKLKKLFKQLRQYSIAAVEVDFSEVLEFTGAVYAQAMEEGYRVSYIEETPTEVCMNATVTNEDITPIFDISTNGNHTKITYFIRLFAINSSISIEATPPVTIQY